MGHLDLAMASVRTVTNPSINQAHDSLTSVIKHEMLAPSYIGFYISGLLFPSMTMPTQLVIIPGLTTSTLWVGIHIILQGPSRRLCISESIIHPSTGTLGSFSYPTSGMRSCSTPLTFSLNRFISWGAHCTWPHPLMVDRGLTVCVNTTTLCRYVVLHQQLVSYIFGTRCHSSHSQWCCLLYV